VIITNKKIGTNIIIIERPNNDTGRIFLKIISLYI
jgi:hypothetical protein